MTPEREELDLLARLLKAAAYCALRWGWDIDRFCRLARICWLWERDGKIPDANTLEKGSDEPAGDEVKLLSQTNLEAAVADELARHERGQS